MADPHGDPSGVVVFPQRPVPPPLPGRFSEPPTPRVKGFGGGRDRMKLAAAAAIAAAFGGLMVYITHPSHADEAANAIAAAASAQAAAAAEKIRSESLDEQRVALQAKVDALSSRAAAADQQVETLSTKAADVDKKAAQLAAEEKKLQSAIDASQGSVDTEGDEIHLKLVDKVLFATGDDKLTDKGKAVLDKVGVALADLRDKQVWVQGHTDDQPIFVPPPKKDPKTKKPAKGAPPAPEPIRFITNWELSAARALQVVHYLQDVAKIDPTRLAALAFGQYRPVSRTNKAANRRIEIVLYPRRTVLAK